MQNYVLHIYQHIKGRLSLCQQDSHPGACNLSKYRRARLNPMLPLKKFSVKVIKSVKKFSCFSRISEISLDKFERIWSMKGRERNSVKGERADGS